ncbi:MAG TPA: carboxypeptidase-like regulatory domain-containing protein, partial [Blastocatellia bacterium]|nr:carboxypeptidase-like regulatory domain-containing protein [Blastocatellia bacterium]
SGGAAVNMEGKLIGIATKVEVDRAQIGFQLGTIGYLRPSHLVSLMLDRWRAKGLPEPATATALVRVKGRVKFRVDGRPIAGVRLGLIIAGREVAPESLVTWGGTNADGDFQFEKAVPPGRYTLRARVIGDNRYAVYNREIEITPEPAPLIVEIEAAKNW